MFKKFTALLCSMIILMCSIQNVFADQFVNRAFVGSYLSAGATDQNYAALDILKCDENTIVVDFKFIKNGIQQLVYTFSEGTMNNNKGTVRFSVSYSNGKYVSDGTMKLDLEDWCVKVSCDSDQGQHLFDGTMKPQFDLKPFEAPSGDNGNSGNPIYSQSRDLSVYLNSEKVVFPEGTYPVIINDHTYVPLRSVFKTMGINVYWDQFKKNELLNAQSITCTKNDTIIQFMRTFNDSGNNVWTLTKWVGQNTDSVDFKRINITELQPVIIENRSYIPLRVVSEAFDATVGWLTEERRVEITCDTSNSFKYDDELIGKIEDYSLDIAKSYVTDDFTSVSADTTPYFSPQAKFYKFGAKDKWGNVVLNVIYGNYIDVFPVDEKGEIISPTPAAEPTTPSEITTPTQNESESASPTESATTTV